MVALSENGRPGVTQEQRGFNVEIKARYLRPQGSFFFVGLFVSPTSTPPFLPLSIFPFQRLVSGSDRGSAMCS